MANDLKGQLMHLMAGNLSCQELADLLTEYLEGSMSFFERVRFQIHLGFCSGCRNNLNQMRYTIQGHTVVCCLNDSHISKMMLCRRLPSLPVCNKRINMYISHWQLLFGFIPTNDLVGQQESTSKVKPISTLVDSRLGVKL